MEKAMMEVHIKCWDILEEETGILAGTPNPPQPPCVCICVYIVYFQFLLIFALITLHYNYQLFLPPSIKLNSSKGHRLDFIINHLSLVVVHI